MKSSLKNMVLVLFCITLISSACVGLVNMITVEPIAKAKEAAVKAALAEVLPEFDEVDEANYPVDGLQITSYKATKDGAVVGYAIKTATKNGFSGMIKMMVGFDLQGRILNVKVLEQSETPGLGAKIKDDNNPVLASIKGKEASQTELCVKKDGGDIDAITASTITSRAFTNGVATAVNVLSAIAGTPMLIDNATGASSTEWTAPTDSTNVILNEGEGSQK